MNKYFFIQYQRLKRFYSDNGIHPVLGYLVSVILFIFVSLIVVAYNNYGIYLYGGIAILFTTNLSEFKRNEFLKYCFTPKDYRVIRIIENFILVFPFCLILIYKEHYLIALFLSVICVLMSFINISKISSFTIPTPFHKKTFEFIIGFRKTFIFLIFSYFIAYKAVEVNNFNLTYVSYLSILIIVLTYYNDIEDVFYVWIYNRSAKGFLNEKLWTAAKQMVILCLPVLIVVGLAFPSKILIQLAMIVVLLAALIFTVLIKYSAYPNRIDPSTAKILILVFFIPPLLLFLWPILYKDSVEKLKKYLG